MGGETKLTEEQKLLQETVYKFALKELEPIAKECGREEKYPKELMKKALQLHGGYGYIDEYDVQRFYRDAKILEIYEGAKEAEKITIAKRLF